ncbi:MAG: hypothetical protein ACLFT0_17745, partial [Spirulinaceae cyanobacterium]
PTPTPQPESTPTPSPSPSPSPTNIPENPPPSSDTPEDETTPPGGSTHDSGLLGNLGNTGQDSGTSGTTAQPDDFFALFPRYPNAEQGSGGVLRNEFETAAYLYNTSDNIDRVIAGLDSELQNTPFTWEETLEDGNFKVYQVTNTETSETKYLHLLSQNEKTVLYLEENDYTLAQLSEAEVKKMEDVEFSFIIAAADLDKVRSDIIANHPRANQFQDRENFAFYKSKQEVANPSVFAEQIKQATSSILPESQFITLNDSDNSLTYKVVNEGSYTYLMFVQGNDGQSVMIISPINPFANT